MSYTAKEIASVTDATIVGDPEFIIRNIAIDSRTLTAPESVMFIAIRGVRHNGHNFIADLYQHGLRCFLVDQFFQDFGEEGTWLVVDDCLEAFQKLAAFHRSNFNIPVIGITGSNGKTILKEWIYQCLHHRVNIVRSPRSFNSQVGVPLSAWLIESQHQLAILEAGISKPGEMEKLEKIIQPTLGIFTNIGEVMCFIYILTVFTLYFNIYTYIFIMRLRNVLFNIFTRCRVDEFHSYGIYL
ncbi:MAG: hypothetical protein HC830_03025 [Bacteroidetes bacterium]|nr:hypothetical protein [Bacteroidota bacterium]